MNRRDSVLVTHRDAIRAAAARNKCRTITLVGSVARGEDADDSDVDFVWVYRSRGLAVTRLFAFEGGVGAVAIRG